jgi:hypothetical protein
MAHGKPVIVIDSGCYHEIPSTCVEKISITSELSQLQHALTKLVFNKHLRAQMGSAAAQYARSSHSVENYATRLLEFLASRKSQEKRIQLENTIIQSVANAASQIGIPASSTQSFSNILSHTIHETLGHSLPPPSDQNNRVLIWCGELQETDNTNAQYIANIAYLLSTKFHHTLEIWCSSESFATALDESLDCSINRKSSQIIFVTPNTLQHIFSIQPHQLLNSNPKEANNLAELANYFSTCSFCLVPICTQQSASALRFPKVVVLRTASPHLAQYVATTNDSETLRAALIPLLNSCTSFSNPDTHLVLPPQKSEQIFQHALSELAKVSLFNPASAVAPKRSTEEHSVFGLATHVFEILHTLTNQGV